MKNMLWCASNFVLTLCLTLQGAHAMDREQVSQGPAAQKRKAEELQTKKPNLSIPDPFPGHQSRPIQNTISVAKTFNPNDYQQEKLKNEGVCKFNSILAGIMHTPYGRSKVEAIIQSQDEENVYIKFYFPNSEDLKTYNGFYEEIIKSAKNQLAFFENSLSTAQTEEQQKEYKDYIKEIREELEQADILWAKVLEPHETIVSVPKKFVSREDKGSFPHRNPEWLNLIQQAYMKISKNRFLISHGTGGYSYKEEISQNECFAGVPFCKLYQGEYPNTPTCSNLLPSRRELVLFPLIDIPLNEVTVSIKETGLDLQAIQDVKAELQPDNSMIYQPLTYNTVVDFAHTHGLTKDLLTASNVVQFCTAGHAVALFFGEGKVHYYDNVYYPQQVTVYGTEGPVYEEAKYFKGQPLETMNEEEFMTRLFQEIYYRLEQVGRVRGEGAYSNTKISFFKKPLIALITHRFI